VGLIALSDPPRADSAQLISELHALGVGVVMVTGDAPVTAGIVAREVGIEGAVCPPGPIPDSVHPSQFGVFAGVLPEDKYKLVKAFQKGGHIVGIPGRFGSQGTIYAIRERRHLWNSRPSLLLAVSSIVDIAIASTLAVAGTAMAPVPFLLVAGTLAAAALFALTLDLIKVPVFAHLGIAESVVGAATMRIF
jgi:hypothetical protein